MTFSKSYIKLLFTSIILTTLGLIGSVFAINWSNTQFMDSTFWEQNPTSGDIVAAVFGSNALAPTQTAYTSPWSTNTCLGGSAITVQYVGTNSLPIQLNQNTIYVLTGNQALTGGITLLGSCIAVVSSGGQYGLTKGTGAALGPSNSMINAINAHNIIIDGLSFDGSHNISNADKGILVNTSNYLTINNVSLTTFDDPGIFVLSGSYIHISNSSLFAGLELQNTSNTFIDNIDITNSSEGLIIENTSGSIITNSRFYNNQRNVSILDSSVITINNVQSFNNANPIFSSIDINQSSGVSINNSMIYNAITDGIKVYRSTGVLVNNTISAYNTSKGIVISDSTGVVLYASHIHNNDTGIVKINSNATYYGTNFVYANPSGDIPFALNTGFFNDNLVAGLSWSTGSIVSTSPYPACYARSYPETFIPDLSTDCLDAGLIINAIPLATHTTLFAEKIPLQKPILKFNTGLDTIVSYPGLSYNASLYISDNSTFGGTLSATGGSYYQSGKRLYSTGQQLVLYSSESADYMITGDLVQTYTGTSNGIKTINIQWSTGDGLKVITGYYSTGVKQSQIYRVIRFYDTTAPSVPTNMSPVNSGTFVGSSTQLTWSTSTDTGVGLSGYAYLISNNTGFTSIVKSGWTTGDNVNLTGLSQSTYYWKVAAIDYLGNTSVRSTGTMFQYAFSGFNIGITNVDHLIMNTSNTVHLSLYDTNNNILTGYNGTVARSITGGLYIFNPPYNTFTLPATTGLIASSSGVYTFNNALNITYPGVYILTVYDTQNPNVSGNIAVTVYGTIASVLSGSITVTPSYSNGPFTVYLTSNNPARYELTGPFTTTSDDIVQNDTITTAFNTNVEGSYPIQVFYGTGPFVYTASTSIILDTTAPTITSILPTSGTTISGSMSSISWSGSEFGTASFSGYDVVISNGVDTILYTGLQVQNAGVSFPYDGLWTISITATDKAGNSSTKTSTIITDTTPPTITNPSPSQNTIGTTPFNFSWTPVDTGGFGHATITLYDNDGNIIAGPATSYGTSINLSTNLGLSTLANGIYQWTLTTYDNAGNSTNGGPYVFTVLQPVSLGQLAGVLDFTSLFGTVVQSGSTYYTNTTQLQAIVAANMSSTVSINGGISPTIVGFNIFTPFPYGVQAVQLTAGDGTKNITALFTAGILTPLSVVKNVILDTLAPTNLTLLSPANGGTVTGSFVLDWSDVIDSGAGLSGYRYQVDNNSGFTSLDISGSVTNSTVSLTTGGLNTGTYYWRVYAYDIAGNSVVSDTGNFVVGITTVSNDTTVNSFTLTDVNDADLDKTYTSNTITVSGLGSGVQVLASLTNGVLFINNSIVGTTGMVDNGDTIKIEMISSDETDESVSTTLSIGSVSDTWTITTTDDSDDDDSDLSRGERLQLSIIFNLLVDTYEDNPSRALAFFQTLQNAIENLLDDGDLSHSEEQSLQYFLDLIENYLDDEFDGVETVLIYTAPNGKKYRVAIDETRNAYYSPDFIKPAYFDSKESFASYIDRQNPGYSAGKWSDGQLVNGSNGIPNLGSNVLVTSSGKVYRIVKSGNVWTSPDMQSGKTFATENELRNYIISHN